MRWPCEQGWEGLQSTSMLQSNVRIYRALKTGVRFGRDSGIAKIHSFIQKNCLTQNYFSQILEVSLSQLYLGDTFLNLFLILIAQYLLPFYISN